MTPAERHRQRMRRSVLLGLRWSRVLQGVRHGADQIDALNPRPGGGCRRAAGQSDGRALIVNGPGPRPGRPYPVRPEKGETVVVSRSRGPRAAPPAGRLPAEPRPAPRQGHRSDCPGRVLLDNFQACGVWLPSWSGSGSSNRPRQTGTKQRLQEPDSCRRTRRMIVLWCCSRFEAGGVAWPPGREATGDDQHDQRIC
jgi:hypothetical protein